MPDELTPEEQAELKKIAKQRVEMRKLRPYIFGFLVFLVPTLILANTDAPIWMALFTVVPMIIISVAMFFVK